MERKTFDETMADQLNAIFAATKEITFSKNMAASIVGGRYKLERLVGERKIKAEKSSLNQHGKWRCNASDVLRYAVDPMYKKTKK
jgi:hypothetical protein